MHFRNQIFNADCLEILDKIPAESIDCVISDAPYKIVTNGCRTEETERADDPKGIFNRRIAPKNDKIKSKWVKQNQNEDNALFLRKGQLFKFCNIKFEQWLPKVFRVLKNGTHAYFMINSRNENKLYNECIKVGFKFVNKLVWVKNNKTPNKYYMQQCEFILMFRKGSARNINNMGTANVLQVPNIIGNKLHPTQKPIALMSIMILNSTNENEIVLDPFMGCGSTCISAKQNNRQYCGIEIDKKYFDIAEKKLNSTQTKEKNTTN